MLVGVGEGVSVGVGVGVKVGVGVRDGAGVWVNVGVGVGVFVGEGVMDGVSEGVRVGTSTKTGTSLAIAWTVLIAFEGRNRSRLWKSRGPTVSTRATTTRKAAPIKIGRSQLCWSGSPQPGHTL